MEKLFCMKAYKPCRTKEEAEQKAALSTEYRRAYKCEFCDWWHLTSNPKREKVAPQEPLERDID